MAARDAGRTSMMEDTDSDDELPPGWEERATLDGGVYYVNHLTRSTQWIHPFTGKRKLLSPDLPYGWEIRHEEDGSVIFVDTINNRTTVTDPRLAFAEEVTNKGGKFKQRFDGNSTALQIVMGRDLRGKYAIVTGANCGLGFETVRTLAVHGCHVVLACRDEDRAAQAMKSIQSERAEARVVYMSLDLARLDSVRGFAKTYLGREWPLHFLILNAAVCAPPHTVTQDGFELTFQTNHLGHFLLTQLLLERVKRSAPSRIVLVSSESHRITNVTESTFSESVLSPLHPSGYSALHQYGTSKLCNILMARELADRLQGTNVVVLACHPGNMMSTRLSRHWWLFRWLFWLVSPFTKTLQQGAGPIVYCAVHRDAGSLSGSYVNNCCICPPSDLANSAVLAHRLWTMSEDMAERSRRENAH